MENPVSFELRIAAHQQQVTRINAEDWKQQSGHGSLGRLRATLATFFARRPGTSAPKRWPIGTTTTTPAL